MSRTAAQVSRRLGAAWVRGSAIAAAPAAGAWVRQVSSAFAEEPRRADLATRVADLEAYMTNSAPKALAERRPGPQRLDDDLRRRWCCS